MAVVTGITRYHWLVVGLIFVFEWGNALAAQAVAPLAPLFQSELGLSKAEVGFFSSAAFAGAWGVLLVAGSLNDRFGARRMLSVGLIVTGVLMMSMSLVGSFLQAAMVMFAVGLGRGITAPGTTKAITEWFPATSRATAMGLKQTGVPIAGIFAASTLPAVGLVWGWRSALALGGSMIVVAGILAVLLYRDVQTPEPGQGQERKASMRTDLGAVIGNRDLWRLSSIALLLVTVQFSLVTYLALYFTDVVLVTAMPDLPTRIVAAGGFLALCQGGGVFGRLFWGVVSDRVFHGRRLGVLAIIGAISAVASLATGYLGSDSPLWFVTAVVFTYGASAVGWAGLYQVLITETVGRRYAATAVGFSMTVSQFGKVGGPPLLGFVVDVTGSYQPAWVLLALLSVAGTIMAVSTASREKHAA